MGDTKVRVAVVGASGAFGLKHLDGLAQIDDAEVTVVSGTKLESTQEVADKYGVRPRSSASSRCSSATTWTP